MTPDDRVNEAVAAFRALPVPPRPEWKPPAGVVPAAAVQVSFRDPERVASSRRSHRRLAMKLGIGGLAAAVAVGVGLFVAATPQVTLAQAVAEVKKHKLVRSRMAFDGAAAPVNGWPVDPEGIIYRDLERGRFRSEVRRTEGGYARTDLVVWDDKTATALVAGFQVALADTKTEERVKFRVDVKVGGERVVGRERFDLPGEVERYAAHKDSVTTKVTLEGKPAVKVVNATLKESGHAIWLDPATRLPLRIEWRGDQPDAPSWFESGFEWNPALPAGVTVDSLFSTDARTGYSVIPDLKK